MTAKRGKFASIIQLANQDAEPEVTLEIPPEPELPTRPEIVVMPKAIATPTAPAAKNGKSSKRATLKQASFYLAPAVSIGLDQFVSHYNLEAASRGLEPVDRSDVLNILLETLISVGATEGSLKALELMQKLK